MPAAHWSSVCPEVTHRKGKSTLKYVMMSVMKFILLRTYMTGLFLSSRLNFTRGTGKEEYCIMTDFFYNAMIVPFRGMSPAAAELMYIKLAQQLPEYGHEIYQALVCQRLLI